MNTSSRDGSTVWDRTRLKNFGDYYASPIAADGKIYIAGAFGGPTNKGNFDGFKNGDAASMAST